MSFFQTFAEASEYDRDLLYANLEKWWNNAPHYKRRRMCEALVAISNGTVYHDELIQNRRIQDEGTKDELEMEDSQIFTVVTGAEDKE